MPWHVEVMPNSILLIVCFYVVQVALETVHQSSFSLAYVLHLALGAGDAVYEVAAFTVYPDLAGVFSISDCTQDPA